MQNAKDSTTAAISAITHAADAARDANEKIVKFMQDNQSPDAAEQAKSMMGAMSDFVSVSQSINGALLRQAMAGQPKEQSPVAAGLEKLSEAVGKVGIAFLSGGAQQPPVDPDAPLPSEQRQLPPAPMPAQQQLPAPAPDIGRALVDSARQDGLAGNVQDALATIQTAFRKAPGLILPGESEVAAVLRLMDGYLRPEVLAEIGRSGQRSAPAEPPKATAPPAEA